ncbi:MAG TPA: zinc ribbon domain-containing protein [Chloroflexi bacterium]|nr:zinc ribbon domain-containing protein [Chloroflexota bacterium]
MGGEKLISLSPESIMPNYEYRCIDCNHKFEIFLSYQEYGSSAISCPACGQSNLKRIIKPVRVTRSDGDRIESMADPAQLAGLDDDPQTLGRMMRQMSQELGEDMGAEFDEVVDRLEKGHSPEEIERDIPDLGSDGGRAESDFDL